MDKLTLAHEWAMKHGSAMTHKTVIDAWAYADAMQAEADKRNKAEAEQKRKEVREMLNAQNTFIERDGQHFDDVNWQPDWSQAPDGYNWWAADQWGCYWYDQEPKWMDNEWGGYTINKNNRSATKQASSFNYQGDWQDSLRERPEPKCEVDWRVAPSWAKYWAVRDGSSALWCTSKPTCTDDCLMSHGACSPAPSFGFTGTHIVERPHGI